MITTTSMGKLTWLACVLPLATNDARAADTTDISFACVLGEAKVSSMLINEVRSRFPSDKQSWHAAINESGCATGAALITVGSGLPLPNTCAEPIPTSPGSFRIVGQNSTYTIEATDDAGLVAAAGRFLREIRLPRRGGRNEREHVFAMSTMCLGYDSAVDARFALRGHSLQASNHPLQFRTADDLSRYAQEMAIFGSTSLSISPKSPLAAAELDVYSEAVSGAGLKVELYWPVELSGNLTEVAGVFEAMSSLDLLFFPGGDGGYLDWDTIENTASLLRTSHPRSEVWVSAQDLSAQDMAFFWANATAAAEQGYLSGIVYGPHTRIALVPFLDKAKQAGLLVRDYPDITHTLSAQFSLSGLSTAWSMTHGRQGVMPLPNFEAHLIELRDNATRTEYSDTYIGFGAYSEGLGDDMNKCLWSAMGQDRRLSLEDALLQYSAFFFGDDQASAWVSILHGLEQNWIGQPGRSNDAIPGTLAQLEAAVLSDETDWRSVMYLKRGYYDAYIQWRYVFEVETCESAAYASLKSCLVTSVGTEAALSGASKALSLTGAKVNETATTWRAKVFALFGTLNKTIGSEVIGLQDPSLNTATIDAPISDVSWLCQQVSQIGTLETEADRLNAVRELVYWADPGPSGFYDAPGTSCGWAGGIGGDSSAACPDPAPRLVKGMGSPADPEFYFSPLLVGPTEKSFDPGNRLSWSDYAMSFFDLPAVNFTYSGLDPQLTYEARVVFNAMPEGSSRERLPGSASGLELRRLVANGVTVVWPPPPDDYAAAPVPTQLTFVPIPKSETSGGILTLSCEQPPGLEGNGRTCQISEFFLVVV